MTKVLEFSMPVRVFSETNAREHWAKKFKRKKTQQNATAIAWRYACVAQHINPAITGITAPLPCVVRLTRIGSRRLDDDNLGESFKAIRDQIAREIGIDDGDDRIKFEYAQDAIGKRTYAVKVEVYCNV